VGRRRTALIRRLLPVLLGAAFVGVLGVPFALRPGQPAGVQRAAVSGPARKLEIISPHSETIETEFERAFSEWTARTRGFRTEIEWLDLGGTTKAIKFVEDRFQQSPEGIGIDIFFGGGCDPFLRFSRKGLLRPCRLPQEIIRRIPRVHGGAEIYDAQQRWFGACLSGFGLIYNKAVLKFLGLPEPKTWADLGRPEYFSWVAAADPRESGSMHMVYEIILQAYGWDRGWGLLMRIGGNARRFSRSASDVPRDVSSGEAACGMAIDTYGLRAVAEAGPERMAFVLPEGQTVVNADGIGVLKGAPHAELAELFVQFVLSEEGQKLWMLRVGAPGGPKQYQLYRLPVIPGMVQRYARDSVVSIDPFAFNGGIEFDLLKKNARWGIVNDLIGACIIDLRRDLARAWDAVKNLPQDDPRLRELLRPPVGEQELLEMARQKWSDPAYRAETIARWSREAAARYRRIAGES